MLVLGKMRFSYSPTSKNQDITFIFSIRVQIKTESGAKTKANKTGIYKKWKERSHGRISLKGTNNGDPQDSTSLTGTQFASPFDFYV